MNQCGEYFAGLTTSETLGFRFSLFGHRFASLNGNGVSRGSAIAAFADSAGVAIKHNLIVMTDTGTFQGAEQSSALGSKSILPQ